MRPINESILQEEKHAYDYIYLKMAPILGSESEELQQFQSSLPKEKIYEKDGEFGVERDHHITIKYGVFPDAYNVDTVKKIVNHCLKGRPGKLDIRGMTFFRDPNSEFDVFKFTVASEDLVKINHLISVYLKSADTHPNYSPHMTIAYIKKGEFQEYEFRGFFRKMFYEFREIHYQHADGNTEVIYI